MDEQDETQRFAALIVETAVLAGVCATELARSGGMSEDGGALVHARLKRLAELLETPDALPQGASVMLNSMAVQVRRYTSGGPTSDQD